MGANKKCIVVREVQRLGWLDEKGKHAVRKGIHKQLVDKMGKDYSMCIFFSQSSSTANVNWLILNQQDLPLEYKTWLLFYQAVDVILVK